MSTATTGDLAHGASSTVQEFMRHFISGDIDWCACNMSTDALKNLYRYTVLLSSKPNYRKVLEIKDILGNIHNLHLYEIIYLEAQKQSTVVYTLDGSFRLRKGITCVTDMINEANPDALIRVHRSYSVNPIFVKTIKGEEVELSDGKVLPLSARRRTEAIEAISEARIAE